MIKENKLKLAIIGLGYVGLPLALAFSKKREVIGFDTNNNRIEELNDGIDRNKEFPKEEFQEINFINFTSNPRDLKFANCYIITVPTPVDELKKPNLDPLISATQMISSMLKKNDIIIYESTVYPGCIEEQCVPILESLSELKFNEDFYCGYSPERINPGDREHTISNIKKITSGSTPEIADLIDDLYKEIITVGTHKAPSIKVAEAAKVIENTQRDLNIALINELAMLFGQMNIDTQSVLDAAGSKWNFLNFKPGLVGGHCIGVDPYYLTYKAESIGFNPKVILAGRNTNDSMGTYISSTFLLEMNKRDIPVKGSNILIMGLTFKENCADIRNSGVINVTKELKKNGCTFDLHDPWTVPEDIKRSYGKSPTLFLKKNTYDAILIAVAHNKFKKIGINTIKSLCKKNHVIFDLKYLFSKNQVDIRL